MFPSRPFRIYSHLHRLPEDGSDIHVYPLPRGVLPAHVLLHAGVGALDGFLVAEPHHEPVVVGREGVDGFAGYHVSSPGPLELTEARDLLGNPHAFLRAEAVLEDVQVSLEEGEARRALLDLDLCPLLGLFDDEPPDTHGQGGSFTRKNHTPA